MFRVLLAASAIAITTPFAIADQNNHATASEPLQIGATVPAVEVVTVDQNTLDFAGITGSNGAVLVFSRSLDWCPYCKAQALELQSVKAELDAAGWTLNLITYDAPEVLETFQTEKGLSYTFLSDPNSRTIDAFGLRNKDVTPGSRFDGIPHPAIVYITANGEIAAVQMEDGYKDRPPTEGIPQTIEMIAQGS